MGCAPSQDDGIIDATNAPNKSLNNALGDYRLQRQGGTSADPEYHQKRKSAEPQYHQKRKSADPHRSNRHEKALGDHRSPHRQERKSADYKQRQHRPEKALGDYRSPNRQGRKSAGHHRSPNRQGRQSAGRHSPNRQPKRYSHDSSNSNYPSEALFPGQDIANAKIKNAIVKDMMWVNANQSSDYPLLPETSSWPIEPEPINKVMIGYHRSDIRLADNVARVVKRENERRQSERDALYRLQQETIARMSSMNACLPKCVRDVQRVDRASQSNLASRSARASSVRSSKSPSLMRSPTTASSVCRTTPRDKRCSSMSGTKKGQAMTPSVSDNCETVRRETCESLTQDTPTMRDERTPCPSVCNPDTTVMQEIVSYRAMLDGPADESECLTTSPDTCLKSCVCPPCSCPQPVQDSECTDLVLYSGASARKESECLQEIEMEEDGVTTYCKIMANSTSICQETVSMHTATDLLPCTSSYPWECVATFIPGDEEETPLLTRDGMETEPIQFTDTRGPECEPCPPCTNERIIEEKLDDMKCVHILHTNERDPCMTLGIIECTPISVQKAVEVVTPAVATSYYHDSYKDAEEAWVERQLTRVNLTHDDNSYQFAECVDSFTHEAGVLQGICVDEPLITKNRLLHEVWDISPTVLRNRDPRYPQCQ